MSRHLPLVIAAFAGLLAAWLVLDAERQHGRRTGVFQEIEENVVRVPSTAARPQPDGTIVFLHGVPTVGGPARGVDWPVTAEGALRLDREVQMFQWQEYREGSGDNKRLDYKGTWSTAAIDSRHFEQQVGNTNPAEWPYISLQSLAPDAAISRHRLTRRALEPLGPTIDIVPDPSVKIASGDLAFRRSGDWFYHGSIERPLIGDIRIRWRGVPLGPISVIGVTDNGSVVPIRDIGGRTIPLAAPGDLTMEELLTRARGHGTLDVWTWRLVGALLLAIAGGAAVLGLVPARSTTSGRDRKRVACVLKGGLTTAFVGTGFLIGMGWLLFRL